MSTLVISSFSYLYAETLSLNCRIWLKYFYIFAAMTQARRAFVLLGTQWLPKRPLGRANGNSKLINALIFILLIPDKDLGRIKTYTYLKIILLYILATMTSHSKGNGCGPHYHPQMIQRSMSSLQMTQGQ